jgi:hypothetical protein
MSSSLICLLLPPEELVCLFSFDVFQVLKATVLVCQYWRYVTADDRMADEMERI